jgi:DNA mismatch repair protein MutH
MDVADEVLKQETVSVAAPVVALSGCKYATFMVRHKLATVLLMSVVMDPEPVEMLNCVPVAPLATAVNWTGK